MLVYYKYLKLNNYNKIAMRMLKNKFCIIILPSERAIPQ